MSKNFQVADWYSRKLWLFIIREQMLIAFLLQIVSSTLLDVGRTALVWSQSGEGSALQCGSTSRPQFCWPSDSVMFINWIRQIPVDVSGEIWNVDNFLLPSSAGTNDERLQRRICRLSASIQVVADEGPVCHCLSIAFCLASRAHLGLQANKYATFLLV